MTDAERQDMTCATCVWFRPNKPEEADADTLDGVCRRFPPLPIYHPAPPIGAPDFTTTSDTLPVLVALPPPRLGQVHPNVMTAHWCGEWRK